MTRAEALKLLTFPEQRAVDEILKLAEKAQKWEQHQANLTKKEGAPGEAPSPTTPSGMTPTYLKPNKKRPQHKKPGRKKGHAGSCRAKPETINHWQKHTLQCCPHCHNALNESLRSHKRIIEDIPTTSPTVTEHTVYGYGCSQCKNIVTPVVNDALPGATLGLNLIVYTAWLHYLVGTSVGNLVRMVAVYFGMKVSHGGLTLAWKNLARHLEADYDQIGEKIRTSAVLHADETGWRINGITHWLWAFTSNIYCYYLIDRQRSSAVVAKVLGTLFDGILITDFWGAYNAIEAMAKQRCYFHLFTELIKVDKRNPSGEWLRFRNKLSRFMKDAVRLMQQRQELQAAVYHRRKRRLHQRLDEIIVHPFDDGDALRLIKRLKRHRREILTFLDHEDVSPYNNHAEQQTRKPVITRKISQQNRSDAGAKAHAILMTLFRSAELQGLNPVDYVLALTKASISGQTSDILDSEPLKLAA
jgi:transposase